MAATCQIDQNEMVRIEQAVVEYYRENRVAPIIAKVRQQLEQRLKEETNKGPKRKLSKAKPSAKDKKKKKKSKSKHKKKDKDKDKSKKSEKPEKTSDSKASEPEDAKSVDLPNDGEIDD